MKNKLNFKQILRLMSTFFKIGLCTFGGGLAMIPIIHEEVIEKKKWIKENDLLNIIAISESTPGPVAVNIATFIGYQVQGFFGAFFATLGLVLPSFGIITLIAAFYESFMEFALVQAMFKGIKIAVIVLLFNAAKRISKGFNKTAIGILLFVFSFLTSLLAQFLGWQITIGKINLSISILLILFGFIMGIILVKKGEKE